MKKLLLSLLVLAPFVLNAQSITDSLLLYYTFDGDATDQSGNGYNGTVSGATLVTDRNGTPNSAYSFDGVNDYIEFPNISHLKPQLPISFAFWVKTTDLHQGNNSFFITDFAQNSYAGAWMNLKADQTGKILLNFGGNNGGVGSSSRRTKLSTDEITAGQWYHITGVIRGATDMDIYIDCDDAGGTYDGTGPTQIAYSNNAGNLGRLDSHASEPPRYFNGVIDDFAYWSRALTPSDVAKLCNDALSTHDRIAEQLSVYPNPSNDIITFDFNETLQNEEIQIDIINSIGQAVMTKTVVNQSRLVIAKADLSDGIYHYRIRVNDDMIKSGKLVFVE